MYCPRVKKIHQNIKLMHKAIAYWLNTLLIIQKSRVQVLLALGDKKMSKKVQRVVKVSTKTLARH